MSDSQIFITGLLQTNQETKIELENIDDTLLDLWLTNRDQEAFMSLILKYEALMRRVIAITLGSSGRNDISIVDDVFQETCIRLLQCLKKYRHESEIKAFFAAVARRASLDEIRKKTRIKAKTEHIIAYQNPASFVENDISKDYEKKFEARQVIQELEKLGEPDRTILYLHEAENINIESLAKTFHMPSGTIKSRLSRARNKIRQNLEKENR